MTSPCRSGPQSHLLCFNKVFTNLYARLESRLATDLLTWCARVLAEEMVCAYSLAAVCCDPANHHLRHTLFFIQPVPQQCMNQDA